MEYLYRHGVVALQQLQKYGEPYCDHLQQLSSFCDPKYAFLVYPPLFYALCQNSGRGMLLIVILTEWANMSLKWILLGHRPYWWVLENMTPSSTDDTIIQQFPLTCETGPGSPSGHAQLQTALNYAIVYFLTEKFFVKCQTISRIILYPAYVLLIIGVSLSRLYIAAHFPHQCVLGVVVGFIIAASLVNLDTSKWQLRHYLWLTLLLFTSVMATKSLLGMLGIDVLSTMALAKKHCMNPAWIHVDTTPYFSMTRFLGFCAGLGFATTCKTFSIADKEMSTGTRLIVGLTAAGVGKLTENISVPFRDASPIVFYVVAFSYYVLLAYVLLAFVPFVVLKVIGGETKAESKKKL